MKYVLTEKNHQDGLSVNAAKITVDQMELQNIGQDVVANAKMIVVQMEELFQDHLLVIVNAKIRVEEELIL